MQQNANLLRGVALSCLIAATSLLKPSSSCGQEQSDATANDALESYIEPVPIQRVAPNYPLELVAAHRDGWVALSFIVSPEGR